MLRRMLQNRQCLAAACAQDTLSCSSSQTVRLRHQSSTFNGGPVDFRNEVSSGPAMVHFFTTWCAPCKKIEPEYEAFSRLHPSVRFLKVNVEECGEVSALHDIRSIPTFLGFNRCGELVGRIEGAQLAEVGKLLKEIDCATQNPASLQNDPRE